MVESELRKVMRDVFKNNPSMHPSWVEPADGSTDGHVDLDVCIEGTVCQMELKVTKDKGAIVIRPSQYRWFRERSAAGGLPFILLYNNETSIEGNFYVIPASAVPKLKNIRDLRGRTHAVCQTPAAAIRLIHTLTKGVL